MAPPKQPRNEPEFEYGAPEITDDPYAGDVAPKVDLKPYNPVVTDRTPSFTMPDYAEQEWGSNGTPISHNSEPGRGDIPPDELVSDGGPTIDWEPRYAEEPEYPLGGGYFDIEQEEASEDTSHVVKEEYPGGGGYVDIPDATESDGSGWGMPLPEGLVDLPPSGMEVEDVPETPPGGGEVVDEFKEGLGTSTVVQIIENASEAVTGPTNIFNFGGFTTSVMPTTNYVESHTYNEETNTFNETHNYYNQVGQSAGNVLDTAPLVAAIGAAGALLSGSISSLGAALLGAIAGGAARGATQPEPNITVNVPPSEALSVADEGNDRYVGYGGGASPQKNCEQLFQEILQLGGSIEDLPEACRAGKTT